MMVSPSARCGASSQTTASTIPAGTISQTERGASSCCDELLERVTPCATRRAGRTSSRRGRPRAGAPSCSRPCGRGPPSRAASRRSSNLDRATRRPRAFSVSKSPAACARISRGKPNGGPGSAARRPGRRSPGGRAPCRAALVQLPGRVQVARAVAVRDDEPALAAARDQRRRGRLRRVDERLDAEVVALRACASSSSIEPSGSSSGSLPVASTSFVLSFAAWTSGWSKGLISRYAPATAIANSQRKNSAPSAYGSGSSPRPPDGRPVGTRRAPGRALPVLARRLGDQLLGPEPETAGGRRCRSCRGPRANPRRAAPELVAGIALLGAARLAHLLRPLEQARGVDAHQRGRHDPEQRERRVAAADRGSPAKSGAEAALAARRSSADPDR